MVRRAIRSRRRASGAGGARHSAHAEPGVHEGPGDDEAESAHQERWNRFDGEADGEVGRTPDDVHRGEGDDDLGAPGGVVFHFVILLYLDCSCVYLCFPAWPESKQRRT